MLINDLAVRNSINIRNAKLSGMLTGIEQTPKSKNFALDDIDMKIINLLQQNGRMSNVDLANRVGLSPPPCLRRLRVLEREKIITGYTTQIDYKKLGYEVKAMLIVCLNSSAINNFIRTIAKLNNVTDVKTTVDSSDVIISFVSRNVEDYSLFLKTNIQNNENVKSFKSYIVETNS